MKNLLRRAVVALIIWTYGCSGAPDEATSLPPVILDRGECSLAHEPATTLCADTEHSFVLRCPGPETRDAVPVACLSSLTGDPSVWCCPVPPGDCSTGFSCSDAGEAGAPG